MRQDFDIMPQSGNTTTVAVLSQSTTGASTLLVACSETISVTTKRE